MTAVDPLGHAATLNEVLRERAAGASADRGWLTLLHRDRVVCELTFGELQAGAAAWAAHLAAEGAAATDRVLLVLPTERAFYEAYWGILLAGAVPVPAYPPVRLGRMEEYLSNLGGLARRCGARLLITDRSVRPLVSPVAADLGLRMVLPEDVPPGGDPPEPQVAGGSLALLQYTSGSTGNQKGVMLTHANLLANLRAIGRWVGLGPEDRAVSWLPLYHDMGLIGLMLGTLYWGIPLVAMSPVDFLRRPARWLQAISRYRATVSAGPNFAYSLVARKARDEDIEGLDLSSWRLALCGAEPIYPATVERFTQRLAAFGFRPESFFPAYGLAENTLAVSFSDPGGLPHLERVDGDRLEAEGRAVPCAPGPEARTVVSVGRPLDTVEVRVVDEQDQPAGEGVRGEVVVRGPSVMEGYFGNPEATAETLRHGWLHTGDLGFLLGERLYISGRRKDLVIKGGRNYFAEDLEAAAGRVAGVRPGGLSAFSVEGDGGESEQVVLVAEATPGADPGALVAALRREVAGTTGCRPDRVTIVPPRTLPKTSSGKIQRFKVRQWYLDGSLDSRGGERQAPGWWAYLKAWLRDKLRLPNR